MSKKENQQKIQYLIVKCEELNDQYECDANRTPMMMVTDFTQLNLDYDFEAYRLEADGTFTLIKMYEEHFDEGMALVKWTKNQDDEDVCTVLKKWNGKMRQALIPLEVQELIKSDGKKLKEAYTDIQSLGSFGWQRSMQAGGEWYAYGEYYDHHFPS